MPTNKKTVVFASGVWDLTHWGHVRLLKRAKALGDKLVVAVNSDRKAARYKHKPVFPEEQRLEIIHSIRYVDEAFMLDTMDLKPSVLRYGAKVIVHGDDCSRKRYLRQTHLTEEWLKENGIELVMVPYTKGVSSTINLKLHGDEYERLHRRGRF